MRKSSLFRGARRPSARAVSGADYRVGVRTPAPKLVAIMRAAIPVTLLAVALALALGAGSAAASGRAASGPALLGGMNIGQGATAQEADRAISVARQLHARLVRAYVPWSVMEPLARGQVDPRALAYTDRLAADAQAAQIKIVMTLSSTPCWASSAPAPILAACRPGTPGTADSYPPASPSDYGEFAAFLAQRYQAQLAAIEVWNEPDQSNENYFAGKDKAAHYAEVLRATYPAVKRVAPAVAVLGGSFVGANGAFLRALYAAGIKGYYDGLSVHFYTLTLAALRFTHEVQLANGDRTPLWLDEFGWSSCWPKRRIEQEQGCVTSRTQAANITNSFRALAQAPYVAAALLYKLRDSGSEEFGALTVSGAHKPAFSSLAHVLANPRGGVSPVTLSLSRRGASVLARGSGLVGDYVILEVFQGPVLRYRAFIELDRFNRFAVALPSVLGTTGLRVKVSQVWTGRAVQRSI